jgi:hypothetical protein
MEDFAVAVSNEKKLPNQPNVIGGGLALLKLG